MKIFVVLCMVTVGLATRLHHRENLDTWTKIGDSYFKVFDGPSDWDTAQSNCEDVSGSINIGDEIVKRATGHLAYDKNDEIHAFLKAEFEEDSTYIWLGAHDRDVEGEWNWGDGTPVARPGHWDPDNLGRDLISKQDCMLMGWKTPDNWDDVYCTINIRYACQIDF